MGKASLMPNVVVVDVANKEAGDTITYLDLNLDGTIKINDPEDEIYAVIKEKKEQVADIEEEAEETEEAAETSPEE